MVVPGGVDEVDEADASFDQPPGEQAVSSEALVGVAGLAASALADFLAIDPVQIACRPGFAREVDQLGRGGLHAVGQFVAGDAAGDLGVASLFEPAVVDLPQHVEALALELSWQAAGVGEVEDRFTGGAEPHSGVEAGQKTTLPQGRSAAGSSTTGEHDVTGQVAGLVAQAVVDPRSHRRQAEGAATALHHQLAGVVVELFGIHRADQQQVVGTAADVWQEVGELGAALAVGPKGSLGAHQSHRVLLDEGEADVLELFVGHRLPVQLVELRLGVEEVQVGRGTGIENEDARLGTRLEVGRLGCQRIGICGEQSVLGQQRRQTGGTQATGRAGQEVAACTFEHIVHLTLSSRG